MLKVTAIQLYDVNGSEIVLWYPGFWNHPEGLSSISILNDVAIILKEDNTLSKLSRIWSAMISIIHNKPGTNQALRI